MNIFWWRLGLALIGVGLNLRWILRIMSTAREFRQQGINGIITHTLNTKRNISISLITVFILFALSAFPPHHVLRDRAAISLAILVLLWTSGKFFRDSTQAENLAASELKDRGYDVALSITPYMEKMWSTMALIVIDKRTGIIIHASANAEKLFGYSRGTLAFTPVNLLIPDFHANTVGQVAGVQVDGTAITLSLQLCLLDNARLLLVLTRAATS